MTMSSRFRALGLRARRARGAAAGCSRQEESTPSVATPSVTLARDRVAIGSPFKVTYKFDVAPNATIRPRLLVFVHVLDDQGEQLWNDDHPPPTPTSPWKAGQTVEYTRTIFVPNYPYIGEAHVRLGLYSPSASQRLPLCATEVSRREYEVAKFQLLPQSENIFLIYKDGWHPAEVSSREPDDRVAVDEEGGDDLVPEPEEGRDLLPRVRRPDRPVRPPAAGHRALGRSGHRHVRRRLEGAEARRCSRSRPPSSGPADMVELTLEVDQTFKPGGGDSRELGIRVFHTFIEPK